jgi:ionotropic glutamate receptor
MASSWSSSSTTSTSTLLRLLCLCAALPVALQAAARPPSVTIGALFTFDSVIGRSARTAIQLAVDDVNRDPAVLRGTNLSVIFQDTKCSGFVGTIQGTTVVSYSALALFALIGVSIPSLVRLP